jgi:dihydroorotase-like cyclic amidohydrolase
MSALLIRGGTVVNADREFRADVLCDGGKIVAVGETCRRRGARCSTPAAAT